MTITSSTSTALRLHGEPELIHADGRRTPLRGRAAALLALAALEPGIGRERAAAWLWPDAPNPRHNLRQQLHRLRQSLGFDALGGGQRLSLAAALELLPPAPGAELLAGEVADDSELGRWLAQQRMAARQRVQGPLLRAAEAAEAAGDLDAALTHARELLAHEPLQESHHATVLRLHYLRGELAAARAAEQALRAMLREQFGAEPAPATRALLELLHAAGTSVAAGAALPALPLMLRRPPQLVGRDADLARVRDGWAQACAVLVEGDAGIGKSRLLTEAAPADSAGLLHASGRPGDDRVPFATLARWLRRLDGRGVEGLTDTGARQVLMQIGALPLPAGQPRPAGDLLIGVLQAAVLAWLDAAAVRTAVLDDLHFADGASLELLPALIAADAAGRHWLLASRPAESGAAVRALRDDLLEDQRLVVVALQPLDAAATTSLLQGLALPGLDAQQLGAALVRHTGGNPLFVLETLKQGLVDGSLARSALPRPATVGSLIERRLVRLSEAALTLARVAAVAGVDFSIELAEAAIGMQAVRLASAWHELQQAQVLRDEGFAHDLVADAVLRTLPDPVARRLHETIADWLQSRQGEPARVAAHWAAAQRWAEAGAAWVEAARRAHQASRYADELSLWEAAEAAFAQAGDGEGEFDALHEAAFAAVFVDVADTTRALVERLLAKARGDVQRARALSQGCFVAYCRQDLPLAQRHGEQAIALAQSLQRPDIAFQAACIVSIVLAATGRAAEGLALIDGYREWVMTQGSPQQRGTYHHDRSTALGKLGRLQEARDSLLLALAQAEEDDDLADLSTVLDSLAAVERRLGLSAQALQRLERGLALHGRVGSRGGVLEGQWLLASVLYRECGRYCEALEALNYGRRPAVDGHIDSGVASVQLSQVQLYLDLGRPELAHQGMPALDERWSVMVQANWHLRRGNIQAALGTSGQAVYEKGLALLGRNTGGSLSNNLRASLILTLALHTRDATAFERVSALVAECEATQELGVVLHACAAAAELASDAGTALDYARRARALLQEHTPFGCPTSLVWWLLATSFERHGEAASAAEAVAQGAQWVRRIAAEHVPEEFRISFCERNPVHRQLLAAASRP